MNENAFYMFGYEDGATGLDSLADLYDSDDAKTQYSSGYRDGRVKYLTYFDTPNA